MLDAIKYGLCNLFNLNGRDARQTFWYFVLLVFIVRTVLGVVIAVPMVIHMFGSVVEVAKTGAAADPAYIQARMMGSLAEDLPKIMWASVAIALVSGVAVLPSLVRRLHDSDLSGWWAALPAVLYVFALHNAPAQMQRVIKVMVTMDPAHPPSQLQMMQSQGFTGLLTYVALGLIIYAGVRKSTPGPNRYGDAPVSF